VGAGPRVSPSRGGSGHLPPRLRGEQMRSPPRYPQPCPAVTPLRQCRLPCHGAQQPPWFPAPSCSVAMETPISENPSGCRGMLREPRSDAEAGVPALPAPKHASWWGADPPHRGKPLCARIPHHEAAAGSGCTGRRPSGPLAGVLRRTAPLLRHPASWGWLRVNKKSAAPRKRSVALFISWQPGSPPPPLSSHSSFLRRQLVQLPGPSRSDGTQGSGMRRGDPGPWWDGGARRQVSPSAAHPAASGGPRRPRHSAPSCRHNNVGLCGLPSPRAGGQPAGPGRTEPEPPDPGVGRSWGSAELSAAGRPAASTGTAPRACVWVPPQHPCPEAPPASAPCPQQFLSCAVRVSPRKGPRSKSSRSVGNLVEGWGGRRRRREAAPPDSMCEAATGEAPMQNPAPSQALAHQGLFTRRGWGWGDGIKTNHPKV